MPNAFLQLAGTWTPYPASGRTVNVFIYHILGLQFSQIRRTTGLYGRKLIETEIQAFDGAGATGRFLDIKENGVHLDVALGDGEADRERVVEALDNWAPLHADDAAVRARHANVRDVGRAAWKDAIIGGLHMGVRAENGGDFAIEIPTHGQLFGGGFGVHVEDDYLDVRREFGEFAFEGAKRIIDRDHEGSALGIEHGIFHAIFGRPDKDASARRAGGKIGGAKQTRLVRKIFHDFAAVPNVVAAGEDFNAQAEQFLSNPRSDAEARGGILAIGDAKIDLALGENVRQALANDASAGRADNVTDEKNVHSFNLVQATQETGEKRSRLLRRALLGPEPHE